MSAVVDAPVVELVEVVKERLPGDLDAQVGLLVELAGDELRESWVFQAARHTILRWESRQRQPRSGHHGVSPMVAGSREAVDRRRRVLDLELDVDGEHRRLGDLDAALLEVLVGEYDRRVDQLRLRQSAYAALLEEVRRAKVRFVRDLGEERAAAVYHSVAL